MISLSEDNPLPFHITRHFVKIATCSVHVRISDCEIENQTWLFRAIDYNLCSSRVICASYSLLQSFFKEKVTRNKIFRTGPFFQEKPFHPERFFLKKSVPDQNFQRNKISVTEPYSNSTRHRIHRAPCVLLHAILGLEY